MLFGMLPDMPELLDEVDKWRFMTYVEHFETSGLDFAPLAIEIYPFAPAPLRARFENLAGRIRLYIENARHALHKIYAAGEIKKFAEAALVASMDLQKMVDEGSAIVHGHDSALDQQAIDKLF